MGWSTNPNNPQKGGQDPLRSFAALNTIPTLNRLSKVPNYCARALGWTDMRWDTCSCHSSRTMHFSCRRFVNIHFWRPWPGWRLSPGTRMPTSNQPPTVMLSRASAEPASCVDCTWWVERCSTVTKPPFPPRGPIFLQGSGWWEAPHRWIQTTGLRNHQWECSWWIRGHIGIPNICADTPISNKHDEVPSGQLAQKVCKIVTLHHTP